MRLINVHTGKLEVHIVAPPYAILSHTWRDSEISFQDMTACADVQNRPEYDKIRDSSREAVSHNLGYIWIDTCCIDKSSSAELSEAINSMFRWYRDAAVCFAYLEDLPIGRGAATKLELEGCRWFTRGWTLQELIAPDAVRFYDRGWNERGTKATLQDAVSRITGIRLEFLLGGNLSRLCSIPVAVRMSWASRRTTTRLEDMAYCLLGIFGVNMTLIYGEGANAFIRLQEEIIKRTNDLSILAWDSRERCRIGPYCGILAASPVDFPHASRNLSTTSWSLMTEFSLTNSGLRITTKLWVPPYPTSFAHGHTGYFLCLSDARSAPFVGIHLRKVGRNQFVRISNKSVMVDYLSPAKVDLSELTRLQTIYVAATPNSVETAIKSITRYPPFHFPAHSAFAISSIAPQASWDVFDRIFYTGVPGFSSFIGIVCLNAVSGIGRLTEPVKLGVVVCDVGPKCFIFKWEDLAQQQMTLAFETASEVALPQVLSRALSAGWCDYVEYRLGSDRFRVSASIRKEVVEEISAHPLHSVYIQVFKRSAKGKNWAL